MGTVFKGKPVVDSLRNDLRERIATLKKKGCNPMVLILRVGEREDDISYERGILKNCEILGLENCRRILPAGISTDELIRIIEEGNNDSMIHGIMLFRPLPETIDEERVVLSLDTDKDIDCMHPVNLQRVFAGTSEMPPCTSEAVIALLKYYKLPLTGSRVVVVGRSLVVGKPLAMLLLKENATVTICHSRTLELKKLTAEAEIVVAAMGRAHFLDESYFRPESIVIDVGINDGGDGRIVGDVDFERVSEQVSVITPAIGGIGLITTTMLLSHVVHSCERRHGIA